ncbi:bifunctional metallophosphatase/5'-nucleotidase [uncultured Bacteroides sp.]|uniref:bifunctional metallophosphatase/5'-nucleotidase n=1 Tax=uncultured Bacteroides sp. TaxID=162156 RepID=UPI002AAAA0F7|nr:bifunctional metallophosphatase/5'-nucleotidase [uncultured Bacteroides sp.]
MRQIAISLFFLLFFVGEIFSQPKEVTIKLIHTSDIHGRIFSYDYMNNKPMKGGMARISSYVNNQRQKYPEHLLLLDGGDLLQGMPSMYYYDYKDTISTHICADVMNYMRYDAIALGNHDVETGHAVYDRWISQCHAPVLGANVLRNDGTTYLPPYKIFVIDGVKIAVLGMITPSVPEWVPEDRWEGLHFDDMEVSAKKWMKIIREKEHPDVVVGLFHLGVEPYKLDEGFNENSSLGIAMNVPGFDVILAGHDHTVYCEKLKNVAGDSVLIVDPAYGGDVVSDILLKVKLKDGKVVSKHSEGKLVKMKCYALEEAFLKNIAPKIEVVKSFISRPIGEIDKSVSIEDAFFGPSSLIDFVHGLQLKATGADISFTAPLSNDAKVSKGTIRVNDLFKLYQFENLLYTMELTGLEVKNYLELSYAIWTNQMKNPDDHLLLIKPVDGGNDYNFVNYSYRFDSAAGIIYTVDVTKPTGDKIQIKRMANGDPFDLTKKYKVALNSYRASGGGGLLTMGSGISVDSLRSRIVAVSNQDLRYYMMEWIEKKKKISPRTLNQWEFIPREWVKAAAKRDRKLLFETTE